MSDKSFHTVFNHVFKNKDGVPDVKKPGQQKSHTAKFKEKAKGFFNKFNSGKPQQGDQQTPKAPKVDGPKVGGPKPGGPKPGGPKPGGPKPGGPKPSGNKHANIEMENLWQSDFGDGDSDGDGDVDYGNVNGYGQPQYDPKWDESYDYGAPQQYVGEGGGRYYVAPPHSPIHYDFVLITTIFMFLCVCVCCTSFVCGFSVRHVMGKLIKKTNRYQVHDDEVEHKYAV